MQVKKAAWSAMAASFKLNGNRDIEACVPALLSCIARPAEAGDAIIKLSATTFVQVGACMHACLPSHATHAPYVIYSYGVSSVASLPLIQGLVRRI